ncbi:hypothetical protein JCM10450v2_002736 [Rhodotorula kratochvilovae]
MAALPKPSHIPLPSPARPSSPEAHAAGPAAVPPSPSAFPSLPTAVEHPAAHAAPAQPGISYAKVSKSLLPPTSAPQGTSLPPPPHPPQQPKERLQVSQNGRDSPYARGTGKKKSPTSRAAKGVSAGSPLAAAEQQQQPRSAHKVVPGMPPSMIPAPKKGSHSRTPSSSTPPPAPSAGAAAADPAIPGIGKKRRQSLRKVLPPTASKLSPFAASFDFTPRGAASHSGSSGSSGEGSSSGDDEKDGELLSAQEKADISATVASAGAQGDEFRAKSLSQADAEGEPAAADASPALQSARADKPSAAGAADEGGRVQQQQEKKDTLPVEEARTDRPLGAFLTQAFAHAEGAFAPLALPEAEQEKEKKGEEPQPKQVTIPGAVQASPVADLSWREKRGWWHDEYDPAAAAAEAASPAQAEEVDPAAAAPAAVEPAQAASYEPVLRFPAWTPAPPSDAAAAARTVRESVAPEDVKPLSQFLGSAFSDAAEAADLPLSAEAAARAPAPAPAPAAASGGALASFLSGSFAVPGEGGWAAFESLDERRAEALAAAGPGAVPADEMPLSAEAVAALPALDDVLDVDVKGGKVVAEEEKKEEKRGWWSEGFTAPATEEAGGTLLSAREKADIAETVGSAGAQGDEFRAKSLSQADREGEPQAQHTPASAQSATPVNSEAAAAADEDEGAKSGMATPLGQYLGQAFSGEPAAASTSTAQPEASTSSTPAPAPLSTSSPAAPQQRASSPSPPPSPSSSRPAPSHAADSAPSLTLALASAWHTAPWTRKIWAVLASLAINVGLPFVNGVMLGFGELFARNVVGVRLGWPLASSSSSSGAASGRANTAGVGLRAAGARGTADVPGHAGAKTAVEAAGEVVREAAE